MNQINNFRHNNKLLMLALDHRGSFQKLLKTDNTASSAKQIVKIKRWLIEALKDSYSAVLLDSQYGLPAYLEASQKDASVFKKPYLLAIEKSGYLPRDEGRVTQLELSVESLKNLGAKGVKILLYFHPKAATALEQLRLAGKLLRQCRQNDMPLFLEILTYPLNSHDYDLASVIIESVKVFLENGVKPDVFKLEYPGNPQACQKITKLLPNTPWILLTKGVDFPTFKNSLKIAVSEGAAGFLAGRSLWQDFVQHPKNKWRHFFMKTIAQRFTEINKIALSI